MAIHHLDGHYFVNFSLTEYFLSFFLSFILFPFWNEKKKQIEFTNMQIIQKEIIVLWMLSIMNRTTSWISQKRERFSLMCVSLVVLIRDYIWKLKTKSIKWKYRNKKKVKRNPFYKQQLLYIEELINSSYKIHIHYTAYILCKIDWSVQSSLKTLKKSIWFYDYSNFLHHILNILNIFYWRITKLSIWLLSKK